MQCTISCTHDAAHNAAHDAMRQVGRRGEEMSTLRAQSITWASENKARRAEVASLRRELAGPAPDVPALAADVRSGAAFFSGMPQQTETLEAAPLSPTRLARHRADDTRTRFGQFEVCSQKLFSQTRNFSFGLRLTYLYLSAR